MLSSSVLESPARRHLRSADRLGVMHVRTARPEDVVWEEPESWHEKPRLLIGLADDATSAVCEQFFTEQGFAVETGWCGLTCLELLKTWAPHALIIECDLPVGGGDGLLARLRDEARYWQMPVLLLVRDQTHAIHQPHLAPVADVFGPPFNFRAMLETLHRELPELSVMLAAD